jgi:hypothetical protein
MKRVLFTAPAILALLGCAKGAPGGGSGDAGPDAEQGEDVDASTCGEFCDTDGDGVVDGVDECADTQNGAVVNDVGCADNQVTPELEDTWPPYGLTWTPTGDLGRAGGLVWTYSGIDRADMFHVYWVVCDDPATPCGVSLDGPVDEPNEHWQFNAPGSDLPGGRLVFLNTTHIALADATNPTIAGRLTVTIVDALDMPVPFVALSAIGVTARDAEYGAEILGAAYEVVARAEVYDTATSTWTPYLDYYDAAATPDPGPGTATSFGGSFYDE